MDPSNTSISVNENKDSEGDGINKQQGAEKRTGNVIPKKGFVNQVCREWLVHEDSALAYRLQKKEIEMHYGKNRQERQTVMMDIQRAKCLQEEDDNDSALNIKDYNHYLHLQEMEDEEVAKQLQEQMECEEALHSRILEQADQEMARKLQDREKLRHLKGKVKGCNGFMSPNKMELGRLASCYEDTLSRATKNWSLENESPAQHGGILSPENSPSKDVDRFQSIVQSSNVCLVGGDKELQRHQELEDEELALTLQKEDSQVKTSQYYRDQQLAIEYQDRELAKLLQEKERIRAKKLRHKHKTASHSGGFSNGYDESTKLQGMGADEVVSSQSFQVSSSTVQNDLLDRGRKEESIKIKAHSENAANYSLRPFICSEKISTSNVLPEGASLERRKGELPYIAMPADSGNSYQQSTAEIRSPTTNSSSQNFRDIKKTPSQNDSGDEYSEEPGVPPYMPIQGQKRPIQDKRKRKDGCRQQ